MYMGMCMYIMPPHFFNQRMYQALYVLHDTSKSVGEWVGFLDKQDCKYACDDYLLPVIS